MTTLETRILELVRVKPGQKAVDIASALGVGKSLVNSTLHRQLKGQVKQDRNYRWYPQETTAVRHGDGNRQRLNTPLARLCQYYLDCLSHDDLGGVMSCGIEVWRSGLFLSFRLCRCSMKLEPIFSVQNRHSDCCARLGATAMSRRYCSGIRLG